MIRKILVGLIVGVVIFGAGKFIFAQSEEANTQTATSETTKAEEVGNTICPVSGEEINEETKATYEYEGKIYNFCCPMCIDECKKDPQKYIKKVEEELQAASKEKSGQEN